MSNFEIQRKVVSNSKNNLQISNNYLKNLNTPSYPLSDRMNQTWSWKHPSLSAQRQDEPNLIMDTPSLSAHGQDEPNLIMDTPSLSAHGQDEPNLIMETPLLIRSGTGRTKLDHGNTPSYPLRDRTNQTWSWIHPSLSAHGQDEPNLIMETPLLIRTRTGRTKLDHGNTPPYPLRDRTNQTWSWIHPFLSAQGQDEPNLIMDKPLLIRSETGWTKLDHGYTPPYPHTDRTNQTWSWIHPPYPLRDRTNQTWSWIHSFLSAQRQDEPNLIMETPSLSAQRQDEPNWIMDTLLLIRTRTGRTKLDHGNTPSYPLRDRTNQTWSWINPSLSAHGQDEPNLIMDTPLLIRSETGRTKLDHGYTPPYPLRDRTNQTWSWINPSLSAQGQDEPNLIMDTPSLSAQGQDEPNLIMDTPLLIRSRTGRTKLDHGYTPPYPLRDRTNQTWSWIHPPYPHTDRTNQSWSWMQPSLCAQRQDESNLIIDKPPPLTIFL